MPPASTLADAYSRATDRLREWMNRRLDEHAIDIARLYRADRDRLLFRLRTIYEQYLRDEPTYVRAKMTGANYAIDNAIDTNVADLARELNSNAVGYLTSLSASHSEAVQRHLASHTELSFQELPYATRNVLNELTTGVVGGGTFFDHMLHATEGLKQKITADVRTSLLQGETFDELRDKMLKTFGVDKLPEPRGAAGSAVKVYKNEARRQWNLLMSQTGRQSGGVAYWFSRLADSTTPGCAARHGRKISDIGEEPPRHMNCWCTIMINPPGADMSGERARADSFLSSKGYSRRQAAQMESERGFPWGALIVKPLMKIEASDTPGIFRSIPRLAIPRFASGIIPDGEWYSSERLAQSAGDPDSVLVSTDDVAHAPERALARTTEGWSSLRQAHGGMWIETVQGYVLDSPALGPAWEPRSRRLPLDIIQRWPRLRSVTFPALKPDQVYSARILSVTDTRAASLGIMPEREWLSGRDLGDLMRVLVQDGFMPTIADPHLAVAVVNEARQGVSSDSTLAIPVVITHADDIAEIVNLASGAVAHSNVEFNNGLLSPYRRVAILCFEPDKRVWAIRPRGMPFWALPGGHIDKDEEPRDAAMREMAEETGVPVTVLASLGHIYRPWSTTEVFLARRDGPVGQPETSDEIDAAAAVPLDNLENTDRLWIARKWPLIQGARVVIERIKHEAYNPSQKRDPRGRWVTVYHGTTTSRAGKIERSGLKATAPGDFTLTRDPRVAMSYAKQRAKARGETNPTVVAVRVPQNQLRTYLSPPSRGIRTGRDIPGGGIEHTMYSINKAIPPKFISRQSEVEEAYDAGKHPKYPAGSSKGGQFRPKGGAPGDVRAEVRGNARTPAVSVTVGRLTKNPAFKGKPVKTRTGLSKLQQGDLGEAIVVGVLQQQDPSARLIKPGGRTNYPLDGVERGFAFDVKTGNISVTEERNQHWRLTIGEPSEQEKATMGRMSREQVRAYNQDKAGLIIRRKEQAAQEVASALGKPIRLRTYTTIVNPDTRQADIFRFEGLHPRIGWNEPTTKAAYIGTVSYTLKSKESDVPLLEAVDSSDKALLARFLPDALEYWQQTPWFRFFPPEVFIDFERQLTREYKGWIRQLMAAFSDENA